MLHSEALVSNTRVLSVGVRLNGTGTSEITQQILKMDFKPYSANYFKPGLPYYGKVGDHASSASDSASAVYCIHSWLSIFYSCIRGMISTQRNSEVMLKQRVGKHCFKVAGRKHGLFVITM